MRSGLRVAAVVTFLLLGTALPLAAHPLGNFTINHLTKLAVRGSQVDIRYVLDMAEIPTYQVMREATPDGRMDRGQLASWAQSEAASLLPQMRLDVAEVSQSLRLDSARAVTRPGAGGLPTLYLVVNAQAALPRGTTESRSITYRDATFPERLGWRDVVVAPASEPTDELTAYPSASLSSPRATTSVTIDRGPNGSVVVRAVPAFEANTGGTPTVSQTRSNALSDMLARGTGDWTFVLLTFLVAIALGALHALEPGHGKTLLAISLVGARATIKQAAILASALTVAHTIGVLALGVAINVFKGYFVPETIYPWITLGSGIVIAIIGARAIQRQLQQRQPLAHTHGHEAAHAHDHGHAHEHGHAHDHGHAHAHGHEHGHGVGRTHGHDDIAHARSHAIPGSAPLTFGSTVWAAMSGGVAPCPAALVVLLAAVALNQVAYGIFVIVAFSFGLAATLTGLGIAVVRGASWLQGRPQFERFVTYGPVVSAVVISTIGAIMVGQGFAERGIAISPVVVTVIVAFAIAGYAFSHPFAHRRVEAA